MSEKINEIVEDLTVDELKELREAVREALSERREEAKESAKAVAEARAEKVRGLIADGDIVDGSMVNFLYKRETVSGQVKRINEKTLTIQSDAFAENAKDTNYVQFKNVLGVVAQTEEE